MNVDLSNIIITFNSAPYVENCLNSIFAQQSNVNYETIVIDNASTDSSVDIVKKKFPNVILKVNSINLGFSAAINQAVNLTTGKYILLLNPDTVLSRNFLEKLFNFIKEFSDCSIAGVKIIDTNDKHQPSSWKKMSLLTVFFENLLPYQLSIKLVTKNSTTLTQVENVCGACMLIRRDVFEELGGFDERFFLYYEEIDFCLRANQRGYKVYYNPYVEVVHFASKSSSNHREIFFFNLYNNKLLFIRKHYSYPFYIVAFILVLIGLSLRAAISFIAGCLSFRKHLFRLSKSIIFVLIKIIKSNYN